MSGRYTKEQVIQLCRNLLSASDEYQSKVDQFGSVKAGVLPWIEQVGSWGWLYNKPANQLLSEMVALSGKQLDSLLPSPEVMSQEPLHDQTLASMYEGVEVAEDNEALFMLMIIAWQGHSRAMDMFNQSMDELLSQAAAGSDEALFKAVLVDPAVMASPVVQGRIATGALMDDKGFFLALSKALTKAKPRRPAEKYDPIRYLVGVLDETGVLDNFAWDDICEIFVEHLGLYSHDSEDPYSGLKKLIKSIRAQSGK
ncbi:MAG: hypothetical protein CMK46_02090 [Porticoccus sp.]|jgi:hypothetical protein|uniref:hypothetical protein n=1 Tax=Porticoccus hydrocarbonoclasticus TaxID=1073414 RepID=UPI000C3FFA7A|nr:hypothetical protein [Porticoccus hydrocarbonoclasticus]MBG57060.1 hypothetical protein [Porticoccus sp.]|tara:strand:- start:4125 stop:4889 length:765 start_codon:yes stop_codon:yes gene_type:complete